MYRAVLSVISYEKRELSDINTYKTVSECLSGMIKRDTSLMLNRIYKYIA